MILAVLFSVPFQITHNIQSLLRWLLHTHSGQNLCWVNLLSAPRLISSFHLLCIPGVCFPSVFVLCVCVKCHHIACDLWWSILLNHLLDVALSRICPASFLISSPRKPFCRISSHCGPFAVCSNCTRLIFHYSPGEGFPVGMTLQTIN